MSSPSLRFNRARWETERTRGRRRFVLLKGVAGWGLPMFIALGVAMPWWSGRYERLTPPALAISAAVWLAGGLLFGLLTWHFSEKAYLSSNPG